ncbi:unnamed protein product [Phytophthora lilii]|uniref:Unnamed protein product n=1 Tax=Phytophthora lilii TaxID=2077276 RepID=A0A9W6XGL5_9STRA|nr:unnamed protein product [Phytophthora lilii]
MAAVLDPVPLLAKTCRECRTQSSALWRTQTRTLKVKRPAGAAPGLADAFIAGMAKMDGQTKMEEVEQQVLVDLCMHCYLKLNRPDLFDKKRLEKKRQERRKKDQTAAAALQERKRLKHQIHALKKQQKEHRKQEMLAHQAGEAEEQETPPAAVILKFTREEIEAATGSSKERKKDRKHSRKDKKKKKKHRRKREMLDDSESDSPTPIPSPAQMNGYVYADRAPEPYTTPQTSAFAAEHVADTESEALDSGLDGYGEEMASTPARSSSRKRKSVQYTEPPVLVESPASASKKRKTSSRSKRAATTAPAPVAAPAMVVVPQVVVKKRARTKKELARERELRALGQYCPVCSEVYEDDDPSTFVCCDSCELWVHGACDTSLTPPLERDECRGKSVEIHIDDWIPFLNFNDTSPTMRWIAARQPVDGPSSSRHEVRGHMGARSVKQRAEQAAGAPEARQQRLRDAEVSGSTEGHVDAAQFVVQEGGEVPALTKAAGNGDIKFVRYLIEERRVDVGSTDADGRTALLLAAKSGHLHVVRYLAEEGNADVNVSDHTGKTSLMWAAEGGHLDVVRYLADRGADTNATSRRSWHWHSRDEVAGQTAVMLAAKGGHLDVVRYLAEEQGADVNATNGSQSALMLAAVGGHLDVVRYLAEERGADTNAATRFEWHSRDDLAGKTALMLAAKGGHLAVVQYLAEEQGADVQATDHGGQTALLLAIEHGQLDVTRYLAEVHGADLNRRQTAMVRAIGTGRVAFIRYLVEERGAELNISDTLMRAGKGGYVSVLRYLVEERGTDVNAVGEDGWTALMWAAYHGRIDAVQYLAGECDANVDAKSTFDDDTALMKAANWGYVDVVQYLAAGCGAEVNATDQSGKTALMKAVELGHIDVIKCLAGECSANVNITDKDGCAALMKAIISGRSDIVQYLAGECGANVNVIDKDGSTALMKAVTDNRLDIVRCLAECGSDMNATDRYGKTALMKAVIAGRVNMIMCLAGECGANVNTIDWDGKTPLMRAVIAGRSDIVRYLTGECSANVDIMDNDGETALMKVATCRDTTTIRFLANQCNANVNATDKNGYTALMRAVQAGYVEVARCLTEQCGADVNVSTPSGINAIKIAADRGDQEILRILTPLVTTQKSFTAATNDLPTDTSINVTSNWNIPVSELALVTFINARNVGGEFYATWLDADVALKLFLPGMSSHAGFGDEVNLWHRLRHPNVLKMFGACDASPLPLQLFVCEYASKGSLFDYIASTRSDQRRVWSYLYQAALGLEYLHERGIVHGDLRCSNILLGNDGSAKLANFGRSLWTTKTTLESETIRSVRWQAPEVLEGKPLSFSSDVYALGMCILEAVTGLMPWADKADDDVVKRFKKRWRPESFNYEFWEPKCPLGEARNLIWSMCCQGPAGRASITSVVHELECLAIKEGVSCSEPKHDQPSTFDESNNDKAKEVWMSVLRHMDKCKDAQYNHAFGELVTLRERLQDSRHPPKLFTRFHALVQDFYQTITMSSEQARVLQLSATRATTSSVVAFHRRLRYLWAALGESPDNEKERRARWKKQQAEQIEIFVSEASNSYLIVKELKSQEEQSVFLASLKMEIDHPSKYTSGQLDLLKKACNDIANNLDSGTLTNQTPEWFIPWYELIIDKSSVLGRGGFGNVLRAKWLDSDHPEELWVKLHEAALGVQYLHARGVVHGDLKGNNIVIGSDKKAKVTDFGLSLIISDERKSKISGASHWVAPECFKKDARPTHESDIYSLGMCIVEALRVVEAAAGRKLVCLPWQGLDNNVVMYHVQQGKSPARPGLCKKDQWQLVKRMGTFEPEKRLKISTVVDILATLAYPEASKRSTKRVMNVGSVPKIIVAANALLHQLQEDNQYVGSHSEELYSLYGSLWKEIDQIHHKILSKENFIARTSFCPLVADADVSTKQLQTTSPNLVSLAELALRCFELRRRLVKVEEAHFL